MAACGCFQKLGYPKIWFIMDFPIKMDDLGVPPYVYKNSFHPISVQTSEMFKSPSSKKAVNSKTLKTFPCAGPYQRKKYCMDRIILPFLSAAHKPIHRLIAVTTCVHISSLVSWYYKLFLYIHYHNFHPKKPYTPENQPASPKNQQN